MIFRFAFFLGGGVMDTESSGIEGAGQQIVRKTVPRLRQANDKN